MRVLLVLSRRAGTAARAIAPRLRPAARSTAWFLAGCVLAVPYVLGFVAAAVMVTGHAIGAAARIGWSDARRKAGHGAA